MTFGDQREPGREHGRGCCGAGMGLTALTRCVWALTELRRIPGQVVRVTMFEDKGGEDGSRKTRAGVWAVVETGRSNVTYTSLPKAAIACPYSQTTVSKRTNLLVDSDWRSGSASCGENCSQRSWASCCTLLHDVNAAQASPRMPDH